MDEFPPSLGTLALTIAIEFAVIAAVQRRDLRAVALAAILVNCATQPVANALYRGGALAWLLIEFAVIVVETALYRAALPVGWRRAFLLSLLANSASASVGVLLIR